VSADYTARVKREAENATEETCMRKVSKSSGAREIARRQ